MFAHLSACVDLYANILMLPKVVKQTELIIIYECTSSLVKSIIIDECVNPSLLLRDCHSLSFLLYELYELAHSPYSAYRAHDWSKI